ncbi:EH domain-containing protein 4 [Grus japonensis]|uniref:EH domain-containing protein 4 n=1 Tax=Grus japonensis TaxID=30415 RepID=A0ABC9X1S0_GRUJA
MDPPLAKAEPISDGGSASGITELRRGKKEQLGNKLQPERGVRRCERNSPADTQVSEGGGGGAPGTGAEIPLQPVVKAMVKQAVPLQPMEVDGGAEIPPAAHGGPHAGAGGCLKEAVTLWEARAGAGSWQDLWPHGERSPGWSRFAGRTCDPVGDPGWSSLLLKDCTPWKGPTLEQLVKNCSLCKGLMLEFMEDCLPWEGPHAGAGEECEEEGAAETTCDELTTTSIPRHPVLLAGRR